jgi:hypothetical protein
MPHLFMSLLKVKVNQATYGFEFKAKLSLKLLG